MKVICLTGGLASGKSTAVKHLADKGAVVIDADILGHQAYNPGTAAFDDVIIDVQGPTSILYINQHIYKIARRRRKIFRYSVLYKEIPTSIYKILKFQKLFFLPVYIFI